MNAYLIASFIAFIMLGVAWSRRKVYDFFIKIILIGMAVIGLILFLQNNGYIIKVPKNETRTTETTKP